VRHTADVMPLSTNTTERDRTHGPLSAVELRAAALDGELFPLGGSFLPLDLPLDAHARLSALSPPRHDARLVLAGRCAAWVWGWSARPCPHLCCCVSSRHRVPSTLRRALQVREVVIDDDEYVELGNVRVTTPLRTLIDLARHDDMPDIDPLLTSAFRSHSPRAELNGNAVTEALDRRPSASHLRRARSRLECARAAAENQPLLTR